VTARATRQYLPARLRRDWRLEEAGYWRLGGQPGRTEVVSGGEFSFRAADPVAPVSPDDANDLVIEGRMMPYDQWTEISSKSEGHFMERFRPGAFAKTMVERASQVRALFEHGIDSTFGRQVIASVDRMWEQPDGAYFRATLLDGLPPLLTNGIRRGLYGSSVRYRPVSSDRVRYPARSEYNPKGIPEVTVREAFLMEFSVTPFPAYPGATATAAARPAYAL
jgi:HK97 family phage prohead protease